MVCLHVWCTDARPIHARLRKLLLAHVHQLTVHAPEMLDVILARFPPDELEQFRADLLVRSAAPVATSLAKRQQVTYVNRAPSPPLRLQFASDV